jgi:hypothetical protein
VDNNQSVFKLERLIFSITVYPNRLLIIDRSGCMGLAFPKRETVMVRNITSVEASPAFERLVICTNDGRKRKYMLGGTGRAARSVQEAIESVR